MAHTHRLDDQFRTEPAAVLSDEQYEALRTMLEAQHEKLLQAIKPIHDIAVLLLADHAGEAGKGEKKADGEKKA